MCGRYFIDTLPELLAEQFRVHKYPVYAATWNLAPTQSSLIVRANGDELEWANARWGLVPHWSKDAKSGAKMINARGEGVADKPAFRGAFKYRRCIVPASGFFEWQTRVDGKQPYAIVPTDLPCFGFAGLYEHWTTPDGALLETACVLTTTPNSLMANIHDRMPVILDSADYERWIRAPAADAQSLIMPFPAERMRAFAVDRAVGNVRNNHCELIRPTEDVA